ncbi:MAG: BatD family protein [bacterium]|nr:BatD family protein [bacterium]
MQDAIPNVGRGCPGLRGVWRWLLFGLVLFAVPQFALSRAATSQQGSSGVADSGGPVTLTVHSGAPGLVGQPVTVAVRFTIDRDFLQQQAVPLLQRAVDLPVQLVLPWTRDAAGEPDRAFAFVAGTGPSVAVGDRVIRTFGGEAGEREGRAVSSYEVRLTWTASAVGGRECAGTVLRFAFASAFEETLLGGRQPVDRQTAEIMAAPFELRAGELPAGAPPGFAGAIGEFEVAASVSAGEIELGDELQLTLTVRGRGNLRTFGAPERPTLDGLVVQGMVEREAADARVFVFDVLALRVGKASLALQLPTFSPAANDWRTVKTAAVPITVKPRSADRPLPPRIQKLIDGAIPAPEPDFPFWLVWTMGTILLLPATLVILMMRSKKRAG